MDNKQSSKIDQPANNQATKPATAPKKETYPPLPPGKAGNPRNYVPVAVDGRKNPRRKQAAALREKKLKKGKRILPPLTLTRDDYTKVFKSIGDIESTANEYREACEGTGDLPTLNGFCLFCGGNGTLLQSYIDGKDLGLACAARAVSDWIVEQMDQAVTRGNCPVSYAQHLAVNHHGRFNSRSYSEGHNKTEVSNDYNIASIIDNADNGGLPAPPSIKQLPAESVQVIELAPVRDTKGQSRPGTKAAARARVKK